jgi:hypothetical protein
MEAQRIKRRLSEKAPQFFGIVAIFALLFFGIFKDVSTSSAATVPSIITYQGKLLVNGQSASTTQNMMFVLYDAPTGGNALYSAAGTTLSPSAISVTPDFGLFSVDLGDVGTNLMDSGIFRDNNAVYLEVRIGAETLSPRKRITASPYAFNASYLNGVGASAISSTTYIPESDSSGNFNFNHITSTGITVNGTGTFNSITLGGQGLTSWPTASGTGGAFIGLTPLSTYTGSFAITIGPTTYHGYQAANNICNIAYAGSHFCQSSEIISTIANKDISTLFVDNANGWVAQGPPGYTANSNDCNGWTNLSGTALGAFWLYNRDGGGAGWLVNCSMQKAISCCK